jgi:branched-chain amino acid transport system permease protein
LTWSFTAPLTTFIGGISTIGGPILGSICFLALSEIFAVTLGEVHVLIFGFCFILIVLFLPGGLLSIKIDTLRHLKKKAESLNVSS